VYRAEDVVIKPANHAYAWVVLVKEFFHCNGFASIQPYAEAWLAERVAHWAWFSGPPKKV
jgi:hypothetical protein